MQQIVNEIVENIKTLRIKAENKTLIVAIDGRCGAGKTTLAGRLEEELGCAAFHMDDFFPASGAENGGAAEYPRRERRS